MRGATPVGSDFGHRLRQLRTRAGLSQEALAHAAEVSVRALADMERGRTRGPQRRTVQALAEALGLEGDEAARLEQSAALGRPRPRTTDGPAASATLALPRDIDRAARWMLRRATAAALHFEADPVLAAPHRDPDPDTAPVGRDEARAWLEAERAQWLDALRRAHASRRHREVLDTAEAMHWFSDVTQHWEQWVEVFSCAAESARSLGSRQEEAVHLNYLAWSYNLCVHDPDAALKSADAALTAARECGDGLQEGWALGYGAGALHRLGRTEEAHGRLRKSAQCLAAQDSPQARLAELTILNTLGTLLRQTGRPAEALDIHRRSERICRAGIPGRTDELIALYHAVARQQIGNDLAALERWHEAEPPLRQALADFEAAEMPAWVEQARLDLGRALAAAGHPEARQTLLAARDALAALKSPRQGEAAAALAALDQITTVG
ncbi:helix-turn-helix domain-containing protein [Streptomyces sp. Tue6028]|uniref:helix-turn-helix domain-containing protein n=1 Tax=Streptomyces sp. Tue6028 TaxID=2036037 RepID=UPI003D71E804